MTPARPERVSSLGPPPPVLTSARARRGIWSALRHHRRTSQPCPPCALRDPDRVATVACAGHLLLAFTHQPLPHPLSPPAHLTCHLAAAATIPNGGCNFLLSSTSKHLSLIFSSLLDSKFCSHLSQFLRYAINSEKTAVYKVLAALTRETASLSFQIHFEHLLEYDKELAYAICNSQDRL